MLERSEIKNELAALSHALEGARLPAKTVESLTSAMARFAQLGPELQAAQDVSTLTTDIINRIAAGEITVAQGAAEHLLGTAVEQSMSKSNSMRRGTVLYEAAQARIIRNCEAWVREHGAGLVETVDAADEKLRTEITEKLEPVLRGITNDAHAATAGLEKEWARAIELSDQRAALSRARESLVRLGAVEDAAVPA